MRKHRAPPFGCRKILLSLWIVSLHLLSVSSANQPYIHQYKSVTEGSTENTQPGSASATADDPVIAANYDIVDESAKFKSKVYRAKRDPNLDRPQPDGTPDRVAINFYGLTRALAYTIDSINEYLIRPIVEAGYVVDVFVHTYDLAMMDNALADESHQKLNTSEWRLLQPLVAEITSQEEFLENYSSEIEACRHSGRPKGRTGWEDALDPEGTNWTNMACQLNSLNRVGRLWKKEHETKDYMAVMYARPDVLYNCHFAIKHLEDLQPWTVYLPHWQHSGGLNDRFALAVPAVAEQLANRLFFTFGMCGSLPLHSEQYMGRFVMLNKLRFVKMTKFRFYRMRATGVIQPRDKLILAPCNPAALEATLARNMELARQINGAEDGSQISEQ